MVVSSSSARSRSGGSSSTSTSTRSRAVYASPCPPILVVVIVAVGQSRSAGLILAWALASLPVQPGWPNRRVTDEGYRTLQALRRRVRLDEPPPFGRHLSVLEAPSLLLHPTDDYIPLTTASH